MSSRALVLVSPRDPARPQGTGQHELPRSSAKNPASSFFPINLNFSAQCKPAVSHLHHHSHSTDKWMISVHLYLKKEKEQLIIPGLMTGQGELRGGSEVRSWLC